MKISYDRPLNSEAWVINKPLRSIDQPRPPLSFIARRLLSSFPIKEENGVQLEPAVPLNNAAKPTISSMLRENSQAPSCLRKRKAPVPED